MMDSGHGIDSCIDDFLVRYTSNILVAIVGVATTEHAHANRLKVGPLPPSQGGTGSNPRHLLFSTNALTTARTCCRVRQDAFEYMVAGKGDDG